jgi:hypothetical protein
MENKFIQEHGDNLHFFQNNHNNINNNNNNNNNISINKKSEGALSHILECINLN